MADNHPVAGFFIEEGKKWVARTVFLAVGVFIVAIVSPWRDQVAAVWNSPQVTSKSLAKIEARQAEISASLEDLRDDVRRATGEDRVIRQPQGLSYVEEPVNIGENIVLWLTVARTKLGKDCRLVDWTPLFTDVQNVPLAGSRLNRGGVRRQISDDFEKLRVEIIPPSGLRPGRIELYLVLDYECPSDRDGARITTRVPDRTDVVTYRLLP